MEVIVNYVFFFLVIVIKMIVFKNKIVFTYNSLIPKSINIKQMFFLRFKRKLYLFF